MRYITTAAIIWVGMGWSGEWWRSLIGFFCFALGAVYAAVTDPTRWANEDEPCMCGWCRANVYNYYRCANAQPLPRATARRKHR